MYLRVLIFVEGTGVQGPGLVCVGVGVEGRRLEVPNIVSTAIIVLGVEQTVAVVTVRRFFIQAIVASARIVHVAIGGCLGGKARRDEKLREP